MGAGGADGDGQPLSRKIINACVRKGADAQRGSHLGGGPCMGPQ